MALSAEAEEVSQDGTYLECLEVLRTWGCVYPWPHNPLWVLTQNRLV